MSSRLSRFEVSGEADPVVARRGLIVDGVSIVLVTLMVWPWPFFRLTLGLPWAVHVPALLISATSAVWLYGALAARLWGRSVAAYLFDLGLDGAERPFSWARCAAWAAGYTVAFLLGGSFGTSHPAHGLPARWSGLVTRRSSTA